MKFLAFRKYAYWVLLALMACLVVACKGWRGGHHNDDNNDNVKEPESILDRVTEEELNSFNPNIPLTEGGGQSDAFKIHPLDEMIISAPAGAFDQNPEIHVSVATSEQMYALDEKMATTLPHNRLLWACNIDAGLPPDSVLPGKYSVEISLSKLGIPEELYPYVQLVRMDDNGHVQELNSFVNNGVVHYKACQNSVIGVCALTAFGIVAIGGTAFYQLHQTDIDMSMEAWKDAGHPVQFWKKNDLVTLDIRDAFGNFKVIFQYGKTENAHLKKEYIEKSTELENRVKAIEKQAAQEYDKDHPLKNETTITSVIDVMCESRVDEMERRVGRYRIYHRLLKADDRAQELKADIEKLLPQSVDDVIKATKLANRFSRDPKGLGLKPLSYKYNVYIVPSDEIGSSKTLGLFQPLLTKGGRVLVNYDSYLKKVGNKATYDRSKNLALCVTLAHEIGHAFENEYIRCVRFSNLRFFEAIGSVTEHWFTAWMKNKGYVTIADTESAEADKLFQYADRDNKQLLAWPLELEYPNKKLFIGANTPELWGGYMLGDLVQFLCDNKKKVTFDEIMTNYAYNKTFLQDLKDIFGIKSNSEFGELYTKFCFKFMPEIFNKQQGVINNNLLKHYYKHSPTDCVVRLKDFGHNGTNKAYPFAVKVTQFVSNNDTLPYSLFAVPATRIFDHELMFTFLEGDSLQQTKDSLFIAPCEKKHERKVRAAIIYREFAHLTTFDDDRYIDVVALYQPKEPKVLGLTEDGMGLRVYTGDKPDASLLQDPENPYVSGMQMVVINNKTKQKQLLNVPLRKCGQEVEIPLASIGITKSDDIDICMRTRWYYRYGYGKFCYSPATERVNYKQQREQEQQRQTTEPESSTGNGQQFTEVEISYIKFKTGLYANCTHTHYDKNGKVDKTEEYVVGSSFEGGWFDQSFTAEYFTSSFSGSTLHVKGEYEYRGQKYDISFDVTGIAGDCKEARVSSLTCKRVNFESVFGHEKYNFTATYSNIPVKVGKRSTSNPLTLRSLTFEGKLANGMGVSGYSCEKYTNDGWGGYNHYHFDYLDDAANFATLEINFKSVK